MQVFYTLLSPPIHDGQFLKFGKTNDEKSLLRRLEERKRHCGKCWIHSIAYVDDGFKTEKLFKDFINEWIKAISLIKKEVWVSREVVNIAKLFDYDYRNLTSFLLKDINGRIGDSSNESYENFESLIKEHTFWNWNDHGCLSPFDDFMTFGKIGLK